MEKVELDAEEIPIDRRITHDYETDRLLLMYVSGLKVNKDSKLKHALNNGYVYSIIIFLFFMVSMGSVAVGLIQDKKLKLEAVHWTFLLLVGLTFMLIRYTQGLDEPLKMIKLGFFTYENEKFDENYNKLKQHRVWRVRVVSRMFLGLAISSGVFLSFIKQMKKSSQSGESIDEGLPIPVYLPFDTSTTSGFVLGYWINIVALFYLVVITASTQQIFLSIMEQMIAQFQILNLSVTNIQTRAYWEYTRGTNFCNDTSKDLFYRTKEFQQCVSRCLTRNIRHHQTLLRYEFYYIQIIY